MREDTRTGLRGQYTWPLCVVDRHEILLPSSSVPYGGPAHSNAWSLTVPIQRGCMVDCADRSLLQSLVVWARLCARAHACARAYPYVRWRTRLRVCVHVCARMRAARGRACVRHSADINDRPQDQCHAFLQRSMTSNVADHEQRPEEVGSREKCFVPPRVRLCCSWRVRRCHSCSAVHLRAAPLPPCQHSQWQGQTGVPCVEQARAHV